MFHITTLNELIQPTPETIRKAYDNAVVITRDEGRGYDINYSSILTRLIQVTGRFCERFASDLFITWQGIDELLKSDLPLDGPIHEVVCFGIRESGVDHNDFVIAQLRNNFKSAFRKDSVDFVYPSHIYRKLLAVGIDITPDHDITLTLKDITSSLYRVADSDKN